ncbi:MAG: ABC-2 family transporter protein [Caldilineaceae bacterium]|nr:ABC-2 family transporter protein [Caldilineaceae bacterium]
MRLFWEVAKLAFQRQLTYRAATLAGLATNLFFGLLRAAVMIALYGARDNVAGISLQAAITYTALTQALIAYLMIFGWYDLMHSVYSGEVATDLLKPLSYFRFWLAQDVGRAVASLLLRGAPIILVYALVVEIITPQSLGQWLALSVSLLLGLLVSFAWRFLVNLSAFWTPNGRGVGRFAFGVLWVLSGFYLPLRYFPDWFQAFCHMTPFPSMLNTTIEIYLGLLTGVELWQALATQGAWVVVLTVACRVVLRAGVRSLVIQGG